MVTGAMKTDQILAAFSADDARWEAVIQRDRAADGAFYYAVRTTRLLPAVVPGTARPT